MPVLNMLIPASRRIVAFDTRHSPPPGTVALAPISPDPADLAALMQRIARDAPWVPLAVCTTRAGRVGLERTLSATIHVTGLVPALVVPATGTHPLIAEIKSAVSDRPRPSLHDLAAWLARRLGRPDLLPVLQQAMSPTRRPRDPAEDRALRRRLARENLPGPLCLNRLAMLARVSRLGRPLGEVAAEIGSTNRQIRAWLARLAGCDAGRWLDLPGWEWVLEEAVRRRGRVGSGRSARTRDKGIGATDILPVPRLRLREVPLEERHA